MTRSKLALVLAGTVALGGTSALAQDAMSEDVSCADLRLMDSEEQVEMFGDEMNIAAINQYCAENPDGLATDAMAEAPDEEDALEEQSTFSDGDIGGGTVASDPVGEPGAVVGSEGSDVTGGAGQPNPTTPSNGTAASPESELEGPDTGD
ncbi:hypothetical protein ROJ8625_01228 [Roseivivax jejudonensis]|uniref:Uncharacterized protein n=1 Tax=Roseivivax jejudonensis TaxID=1529041 RepID=A0A1X6YR43_9RHOB|nr:hypothetical protein [Roseivivax jejudonensis]SLN28828.1 hypothetical protein ROJ8625_01228 [Roseivivax jejudonensis]